MPGHDYKTLKVNELRSNIKVEDGRTFPAPSIDRVGNAGPSRWPWGLPVVPLDLAAGR